MNIMKMKKYHTNTIEKFDLNKIKVLDKDIFFVSELLRKEFNKIK